MRILVTADLHYNIGRSKGPVQQLAGRVLAEAAIQGPSALVIVGDTAGADLEQLRQCLELFADFDGSKLLVPGNHCLWCRPGEDSVDRYERIVPGVAREAGFEVLDHNPVVMGSVGLVGSIGWYDYSFRQESLGIPRQFYEAKVSPGAAVYLGGHEQLLRTHGEALSRRNLSFAARWMDGAHVRLPMSDEQFTQQLAEKLTRQLDQLSARVDRIVAFIHHLPFEQLVPKDRPDRFAFAAAYMGSQRVGDVLLSCPQVTDVYCGHSHWPLRRRIGHLNVINIGSTYTQKRLEILDL